MLRLSNNNSGFFVPVSLQWKRPYVFIPDGAQPLDMNILDRAKRGFGLLKDSLVVLKNHPRLVLFPILSGISAIAFFVLWFGSIFGVIELTGSMAPAAVIFFIGYFLTTFITVFFTAALVYESRQVFEGDEPNLKRGMAAAWAVKWKLFAWAVITATVGLILNAIENNNSAVGRTLAAIVGFTWAIVTFFVVPTAVLDRDSSLKDMFTRSGSIFKGQWGETAIGFGAVRVIEGVIAFIGIGLGFLVFALTESIIAAAVIAAPFVIAGVLVSQTVQGIVKTALYVYAREGKRPSEFEGRNFDDLGQEQGGSPTSGGFAGSGGTGKQGGGFV